MHGWYKLPHPVLPPPLSAFFFGIRPPGITRHSATTVFLNLITYPTETSKNGTNYLYSAVVECPFIDNISCWIFGNISPTPPSVLRGDIDVDGETSPTGEKNRLCKPNGPLTKQNTLRSELFLLWFFEGVWMRKMNAMGSVLRLDSFRGF